MAAAFALAQDAGLWVDVPFVKQSPEGCGAASLAMVMQYWQTQKRLDNTENSDAEHILRELHSPQGHGIYASAMESYLKRQGYRTFAFSGTWDDLKDHLAKGRPLIVALKPFGSGKFLHYVVVAGIDEQQSLVMFNDPAGRKLTKLDRKSFEKEWDASKKWTLLALPENTER